MFGFGKKKTVNRIEIVAPMTGTAVPLEQVDDPAFSEKVLGDGIAIEPTQGVLIAPFSGEVIHLIDSHHSLVLGHESGLELLFHIGVNTVTLKGKAFKPHIKSGDKVKQGDILIEFDMDQIREAGFPVITPVIVANEDAVLDLKTMFGPVQANVTKVMEIQMK